MTELFHEVENFLNDWGGDTTLLVEFIKKMIEKYGGKVPVDEVTEIPPTT